MDGTQTRVFCLFFPTSISTEAATTTTTTRITMAENVLPSFNQDITTPTNDGNNNTSTSGLPSSLRLRMPSSAGSATRSEATSIDQTNSDDESSDAAPASSLADHSEGYLDEDKAADSLPDYLLRSIARLELLSLSDVEEETNEVGDGGDSDVEGDDLEEHDEAMTTAIAERLATAADDDGNEIIDDGDRNSFLLKKGSHPDLNIPSIPENWVPATQKVEKGEPTFD